MENATTSQGVTNEGFAKNTQAFKYEYGRLNSAEQKEVQRAFCKRYGVSPEAFRARCGGFTRVSDTELAWFEKRVATYFQN
ncbi:hypothetical protein EXU85_20590 [Spirosoma sp. KCTC 42546]|uniref:hypothetical protein n=1 Tax=Spirosoma sp. KCTC 42546 TaxID=2520506 RepID=UPI0011595782|nr:hypothetical protein [Spirosoma sp. KCTC 42546]QDK80879.1 hypothetical protein EXU85_20590 [Spirosoma sp. KCTC 42546]